MNPPFFSIIIPVYNVAPYLRECLDSVLAQTFPDWEAICVDDGSSDSSGTILDDYAARDKRFRVIHQKNAGVSAARNAALEATHGEWFLFLDGDDAFLPEALATFSRFIRQCPELDGLLIHPYNVPPWYGELPKSRHSASEMLVSDATKEDLFLGPYAANGFPFSRVYRTEVFGRLRFRTDLKLAEDVCFWFDALRLQAKWAIIHTHYYLYRTRADSVLGSHNPHLCAQVLESILHAFTVIESELDPTGISKLKYCKRFPYGPRTYLDMAIQHRKDLSKEEWCGIQKKLAAIERQIGRHPFGLWRALCIRLASRRGNDAFIELVLILSQMDSCLRSISCKIMRNSGYCTFIGKSLGQYPSLYF